MICCNQQFHTETITLAFATFQSLSPSLIYIHHTDIQPHSCLLATPNKSILLACHVTTSLMPVFCHNFFLFLFFYPSLPSSHESVPRGAKNVIWHFLSSALYWNSIQHTFNARKEAITPATARLVSSFSGTRATEGTKPRHITALNGHACCLLSKKHKCRPLWLLLRWLLR